MLDFATAYRKKILKRYNRQNSIASVFVFTIFVLQIITALLSAQTIITQWSELTVTWPYEIAFCSCEFMVAILVKICQLYLANISTRAKKERYLWLAILLALPCLLLMCCGLIACRLVKVRVYHKLVWNMSQQEVADRTYGYNSRNATIPYVDTYQVISMAHYDTKAYVKAAWDTVQQKYECCGSNAPQDWSMVRIVLPKSCCFDPDLPCLRESAFRTGCSSKVTEILFDQLRYLEVTIFILMIFECLMIVFVLISIVGSRFLGVVEKYKSNPLISSPNKSLVVKNDEYFLPISLISPTVNSNGLILAEHLG
ncbi:unnamed protein product [Hermetia illucens]|uniref:Tetraspanin n=1 Tax=Hermetia illucens TaxID=343691 RepID=A0A7R8UPZ9_HERIL|nr:CD63 antigen-like [Hermetia illucens]CAD7084520.1 unnamed protein product [Hermetia illucens]